MDKNTAGSASFGDLGRRLRAAVFKKVLRQVSFEPTLEGSEGWSQAAIWAKTVPAEGTASAKILRQECAGAVQELPVCCHRFL